jgi:superoxide dismutase
LAADAQGKLEIMALSNADTPLKHGKQAILTSMFGSTLITLITVMTVQNSLPVFGM